MHIDAQQPGLVLTGPNAGGKTIVLKTLGLLALLVRLGIPVPARSSRCRVDFFSPILADIGDMQSVTGDLSTFSGHLLVCREVLRNAASGALVLMDEMGSGTDPAQGVAIAQVRGFGCIVGGYVGMCVRVYI
jgi:DNA mismatch repair protein MutS2